MARRSRLVVHSASLTISLKLLIVAVIGGVTFQLDFNGDLYEAGVRILHGLNPYYAGLLAHQAAVIRAGGTIPPGSSPRWPAPVLLAGVPLSLLPVQLADVLFMLAGVAAVIVALRLLDVRDGRCVLVALISCPTVTGVMLGNISPLLLLGTAAVWSWRDRPLAPGIASAAVIVSKLFLWPLGVWLLITERRRALATTLVLGTALIVGAWATIGFVGLAGYPKMLADVASIGQARGSSLVALLMFLGLPVGGSRLLAATCGVALLALAHLLHRQRHAEREAFGLVILAALTLTPIVWAHYLVLLYVPIALCSPQLSLLWCLPALSAFAPTAALHTYGWALMPVLLGELALAGRLCAPLFEMALARYRGSTVATAKASAPS